MKNIKSSLILPVNSVFGYILLALGLSALVALTPIWGIWIAISLILAIWTKDDDRRFLSAILILIIFGPIGRFLSPGSIAGSLWAFDLLVGFGLILRIKRFWPIRIGRDAITSVSTPWFFVIFSI